MTIHVSYRASYKTDLVSLGILDSEFLFVSKQRNFNLNTAA